MLGKLTLLLLVPASLVACASEDDVSSQESALRDELLPLRRTTERYLDINNAIADGYVLGAHGNAAGCVANPTEGGMGYHYFRIDRFDDAKIKELKPEALVYHDAEGGGYELGAVEWVVPKATWDAEHGEDADPPVVYGQEMMIINQTLKWYVAHAWIWTDNPRGIFANWNPDVTCPPT